QTRLLAAKWSLNQEQSGTVTTDGGIGHILPYLIPSLRTATAIAVVIVAIELLAISWIRNRYMDTSFLRAAFQVIVGGVLVFLVGIWIGSSYWCNTALCLGKPDSGLPLVR